jgi:hypothetical protein
MNQDKTQFPLKNGYSSLQDSLIMDVQIITFFKNGSRNRVQGNKASLKNLQISDLTKTFIDSTYTQTTLILHLIKESQWVVCFTPKQPIV